jgi:phage protein D
MPVARPSSPLVADFDILIDGVPLSAEEAAYVVEIVVDNDLHLPSMFAIEFTGSASRRDDLAWLDNRQLFAIGNSVDIRLGYANDLAVVFQGEITGIEPEFSSDRPPKLKLRGYDRRHRLQRHRQTRTFTQRKDSDIAAQIASEVGLLPQVQDSQTIHDYLIQANQTDWEFLQERARRIQYDLLVEGKTLIFQPVANANAAIATLTREADILSFSPRLSVMGQISEVAVRGWDFKEKKATLGQATRGDEVSQMGGQTSGAALVASAFGKAAATVSDRPILSQGSADRMAKAEFNRSVLGLIVGEGMVLGRTDLQPGKVIQLDGLGQQFSGRYYLTNVTHCYYPDRGYYTDFQVRRNAL